MRPALACLLALAACSADPPSPKTVRSRIATDLGHVLTEAKAAADGGTQDLPGAATARALGLTLPAMPTFDPAAIVSWLDDRLFTDANYVGDGIYRVPPELVCAAGDAACAQHLADADLRVRVEEDDGGELRFAVQIDADHDEPLSFLLAHDELSATLDLDGMSRAMIALAPLLGQDVPDADLSGQASADLAISGPAHATLAVTVDRPISIAVARQGDSLAGPAAFRFASAAAHVVSLELDGTAPLAHLELGLGDTLVHTPGDAAAGIKAMDLELAGATASVTYQGMPVLPFEHVSLGGRTTTLSADGQIAEMLDLNPDDGREVAGAIVVDRQTGTESLAVSPRLDLRRFVDHAALGDTPPVYDVTRLLLAGAIATPADGSSVTVASGSLAITTDPASYGFTATTGQCVATRAATDGSGQPYMLYAVGACP